MVLRVALTGLFLVALVGCSAAAPSASDPGPTPQIVYVTPAPVAPVVHIATAPPIIPTAVPELASSNYVAFLAHGAGLSNVQQMLQDISDPLGVMDGPGALAAVQVWDRFVNSELSWYAANPADACYAAPQALIVTAYTDYASANESLATFLFAFPYGELSDIKHATASMKSGTDSLKQATTALDSVSCVT